MDNLDLIVEPTKNFKVFMKNSQIYRNDLWFDNVMTKPNKREEPWERRL